MLSVARPRLRHDARTLYEHPEACHRRRKTGSGSFLDDLAVVSAHEVQIVSHIFQNSGKPRNFAGVDSCDRFDQRLGSGIVVRVRAIQ